MSIAKFRDQCPDEETSDTFLVECPINQQEVADQLGYQVRKAVELLVKFIDRADQECAGKLLTSDHETVLFEASLTVMMRLLFLFCAEERELLPLGDDIYDRNYAVSTLSQQLRTIADHHGEEVLEQRYDAWSRLLTTFRVVHDGVQRDTMHLRAYGGCLFNPDRFPFLEGRQPKDIWQGTPSQRLSINDRLVLRLLENLQVLQNRLTSGGHLAPRRLSLRSLDVEQIGHVYESLLDYTAVRATEPVLGLVGTRDKEPEITLSRLEELAGNGAKELLAFLKKETGKSSVTPIMRMMSAELDKRTIHQFRTACHGGDLLWERIKPFAGLVRMDALGFPVVIPTGTTFVTSGLSRSSTGTHFTPPRITEPIVANALEHLVFHEPREGLPRTHLTLKAPRDLLALDICDLACGTGAFLVQACRYLSDKLVSSWDNAVLGEEGNPRITPYGDASRGRRGELLVPENSEERLVFARRLVAGQCLYGVDQNSLACEIAKLGLWLLTLAKDRPFTFLDHAIRCGDSLIGIDKIDQLLRFSLETSSEDPTGLARETIQNRLHGARFIRDQIHAVDDSTLEHVERKEGMLERSDEELRRFTFAADQLIGAHWSELPDKKLQQELNDTLQYVERSFAEASVEQLEARAKKVLSERGCPTPFHWPLEFPEVFERGGFDAILTNPPFVEGGTLSKSMRNVVTRCYESAVVKSGKGPATSTKMNLVGLFSERMVALLKPQGVAAFVCPKPLLRNERYWRAREVLLSEATPEAVFDLPADSFDSASVEPCALVLTKGHRNAGDHQFPVLRLNETPTKYISLGDITRDERFTIRIDATSAALDLVHKIAHRCTNFQEVFESKDGVNPGRRDFRPVLLGTRQAGMFVPNGFSEGVAEGWLLPETFDAERHKATINGRDFDAFSSIDWKGTYLRYFREIASIPDYFVKGTRWSAQLREQRLYDRDQKVVSRQTANTLIATLDRDGFFPLNNVHVHFPKSDDGPYDGLCLLGIFNSSLLRFVYRSRSEETGTVFPQVHISAIRRLPIPREPSPEHTGHIATLVRDVLREGTSDQVRELDQAVFRLYGLTESDIAIVDASL